MPANRAPGTVPDSLSKRKSALCDLRLVDPDGNDVADGEPGEAAVRGPTVFSGYWNAEAANARDFKDGWFRMGDLFRRNADGAYWVLPASDGWVRIVVGSPKQWAGFKSLMRDAEVFEADEWRNPQFRLMNADVIRMVAEERLTDRTRAELFEEWEEAEQAASAGAGSA